MENETKQNILKQSLILFSKKGYNATTVQDIAKAVGIKAPSLYNHFKSKQMIFDEIVTTMQNKFLNASSNTSIPNGEVIEQSTKYANGGIELLKSSARTLFKYYLTDEYASLFSKVLSIEKYNNKEVDNIFKRIYIDDPVAYQSKIFEELIKQKHLIEADKEIMAMHFFCPIFVLLKKYENTQDNIQEAFTILDRHIEQFCLIYGNNNYSK